MLLKTRAVVGAGLLLCACERSSHWANMRMDADATVDGRRVHASTLQRTSFIDNPSSGSKLPVSGVALAIPVAPGRYVYGLFRTITGNMLEGWDLLPTGLDAFVSDEDQHLERPAVDDTSRAKYRNYVIERLANRRIPICLPLKTGLAGQDRCPIFAYFENPADPESVKMLRPGETVNIAGHRFRIDRVTLTFEKEGGRSQSTEADLPSFLQGDRDPKLGKLPNRLVVERFRQLYNEDFRRTQ